MPWAKLDDAILDHPKIVATGTLGFALHVAGIVYCARNLTDGFIPKAKAMHLLDFEGLAEPKDVITRLLEAKLWLNALGGFKVNDYLAYNPSRQQILGDRARARQRYGKVSPEVPAKFARSSAAPIPIPVPLSSILEGSGNGNGAKHGPGKVVPIISEDEQRAKIREQKKLLCKTEETA